MEPQRLSVTLNKLTTQSRFENTLLRAVLAGSVLGLILCLWMTRHWGIAQDTPLIHYVVFLTQHGYAPYRQIVEMNMPGAYLTEQAVMSTLGTGDVAWRVFDILEMAVVAFSVYRLVKPVDRQAAVAAALLVTFQHLALRLAEIGQRDYTMAVMLIASAALMADALRQKKTAIRYVLLLLFGVCSGWAAAIKPVAPVVSVLVLGLALLELKREGRPRTSTVLWSLGGALIPVAIVSIYLTRWHAWPAFWETATQLAVFHRGYGNKAWLQLATNWVYWAFWVPIASLAILLWLLRGEKKASLWTPRMLAICFAAGLLFYFYQAKGWKYQADTANIFLLTWFGLTVAYALTSKARNIRAIAAVLLSASLLVPVIRVCVTLVRHHAVDQRWQKSLERDLTALGGPARLDYNIQCLDWNAGCIGALWNERIIQSTGFIYDFYLFPQKPAAITSKEQQRFLAALQQKPPQVIVLTSQDWPAQQGFARLDRWPTFSQWLSSNYTLAGERWPAERGYRIYLHRQH